MEIENVFTITLYTKVNQGIKVFEKFICSNYEKFRGWLEYCCYLFANIMFVMFLVKEFEILRSEIYIFNVYAVDLFTKRMLNSSAFKMYMSCIIQIIFIFDH